MDTIYPTGPSVVPANITQPSASYRRHAWLAMTGLLVFVAFYLALLSWFGWTAYRLIGAVVAGTSDNVFAAVLVGGCAAFLALFMAKALIFVKRGAASDDIELKPEEQPRLFAFLHRLADEAGAPRPHRVYVSPRVNAAVFYDLSVVNLIFPSKKNLEIGLALVNVLNLGELKAVLAHEFGHFAQRTMAVGRWVYIAQQIASHIIAKRDAFDKFLRGISNIDLRVAWVGWLLRLIVWSIRSLVELIFRIVVLAQRALSREMEYQADLVAASLTGSDALVNALHKLHAADDAWDRAVNFGSEEAGAQRPVRDLFAVQTRIIEKLRVILADPLYGVAPEVPATAPEQHRVFRNELAQPPQMWSTHPANADRENNVKRQYIAAPVDARPAWLLFDNAEALRATMSAGVFSGELPPAVAIEDSLQRLDEGYNKPNLDRRYRGSFLGRSIVRHAENVKELYLPVFADATLPQRIAALYGDDHDRDLDRLRDLQREKSTLDALHKGYLAAPGGVLRWRGAELRRRELPRVIADLEQELVPVLQSVQAHDQRCRGLHIAAAKQLGAGWEAHLRGLAAALHYAEHTHADLRDAQGLLNNTYSVVTADGNVSGRELTRLIESCNVVQRALSAVYAAAPSVKLGGELGAKLQINDWTEALGEFKLPPASKDNINDWLRVVDGWVNAAAGLMAQLKTAALESLLAAEDKVARALASSQSLEEAPQPAQMPAQYITLLPGNERKRQERLGWWDRFQTAEGWAASVARFAVAGGIVGSVLFLGGATGHSVVSIYNGLARTIEVSIDGERRQLAANSHTTLDLQRADTHKIIASSNDGQIIESFDSDNQITASHYVYNVAGAAALVSWTAVYGDVSPVPPTLHGAPRWTSTNAEHVFSEPPDSIQTKGGGGSRRVLSALSDMPVGGILAQVDSAEHAALIRTHAVWDSADSERIIEWLDASAALPDFDQIIAQRLQRTPNEVVSLRAQQDAAEGAALRTVCERQQAMARAQSASDDLRYLAARCMDEGAAQNEALLQAHDQAPDNAWLQYGSAFALAERGQWQSAMRRFEQVVDRLPPVADRVRMEMARLARLLDGENTPELARLAKRSAYLPQYLAMETGEGLEAGSPRLAYTALKRGELENALTQSAQDPIQSIHLIRLVAASEGANVGQIERGLAATSENNEEDHIAWPMLALAMREGAAIEPHLQAAQSASGPRQTQALAAFLRELQQGGGQQRAESVLGEIAPRDRGIAYASAVVLLQDRCPNHWREAAKRLLFAFERPYLR